MGLVIIVLGIGALSTSLMAGEQGPAVTSEKNDAGLSQARDSAALQAKKIYEERCQSCHGARGRGDGPMATDMYPKPTDLSHPQLADKSDGAIFKRISEGKRPMPSYKNRLSEEQRWLLVSYVRTLTASGKGK